MGEEKMIAENRGGHSELSSAAPMLDPAPLIEALQALEDTLHKGIRELQGASDYAAAPDPNTSKCSKTSGGRNSGDRLQPERTNNRPQSMVSLTAVDSPAVLAVTNLTGRGAMGIENSGHKDLPLEAKGGRVSSAQDNAGVQVVVHTASSSDIPGQRRSASAFNVADKAEDSEPKRPDQVTIYARVVFLKLGEIDTVAEKFNADAFIQARWREPNLDGQHTNTQFELCAKDVFWDPKLYVENAMGEPKEAVWQIVSFNEKAEATVYQRRRVKGTFFERMELMQYPFDTQDLTLTLTTERGEQEVDLQADDSEVSSVNIQSFVDEQEWHLHKHINTWTRVTTNVYQNSKHKHPAVSISCKATRRSQFFIWNIILVMVFICSLVFATFSVNLGKPENRIQLTFILLLSNITFKFTVNQTLPKVSYLTYLDKYILISMAILCLVCVWHATVPLLAYDMEMARLADNCAFGVLAALYVMFNVIFFTWSRCLVSRRWREYNKKDAKQKEILTKMESVKSNINEVAPI